MRVAITGMGAVSPLGNSAEELCEGLLNGTITIRLSPFSPADDPQPRFGSWPDQFDPAQHLDPKVIEGSDLFSLFFMAATQQALERAGLAKPPASAAAKVEHGLDPLRTGVIHGTSMGGTTSLLRAQWRYDTQGADAVPGKTMIQIWPNMAAAQVCMRYDLHGPSLTVTTACASSLDAIGTAARLVEAGIVDVAICGGTEGGSTAKDTIGDG